MPTTEGHDAHGASSPLEAHQLQQRGAPLRVCLEDAALLARRLAAVAVVQQRAVDKGMVRRAANGGRRHEEVGKARLRRRVLATRPLHGEVAAGQVAAQRRRTESSALPRPLDGVNVSVLPA